MRRWLDVVPFFVFRQHQLDGDPDQQQAADEFEPWQVHDQRGEDGEHDAQADRPGDAPEDARLALFGRQVAAGQRDDHRVVAGQHDVDQDDLADGDPEKAGGEIEFHEYQTKKRRARGPPFRVELSSNFTARP
jgi:hypothetical protein